MSGLKEGSFTIIIVLFFFNIPPLGAQAHQVELLHQNINTGAYDEIAPVISRDEQTMFFTRQGYPIFDKTLIENQVDLAQKLSAAAYETKLRKVYASLSGQQVKGPAANNAFNQDIWVAQSRKSELDQVHHPKFPLNNAFPNSVCALFNNEQSAILINQFPESGGIRPGFSITHKNASGYWSSPVPIFIDGIENIAPDVSLAVAEEGNAIVLSLEHEHAYGGNDLYVAFQTGKNQYGTPIHLGPAANSMAHEKAPFLSADGKTLFFSSNRRNSRGGYDLYMVYRLDDSWENWTLPKQFLNPINTGANEGFPCFNRRSGYLYFASDRNGSSDIFRVKIAPAIAEEVRVSGNVLDYSGRRRQEATVLLRSVDSGIYQSSYISTNGHFEIDVPRGDTYQLLARKPGYQSSRENLTFKQSDIFFKDVHLNLALKPLKAGETIDLNTIYFEKSTAKILPKSHPELTYLAEILNTTSALVISIEGHTDNRGGKQQLQELSEKRAKVIKQYLMEKGGISSARILTKGYGDGQPLNDNSTEMLRRRNRRVEVKVVKATTDSLPDEETTALERE